MSCNHANKWRLVPSPILHNPAHSSQLSDTSTSPSWHQSRHSTAGHLVFVTWLYILPSCHPVLHLSRYSIPISLSLSPGFTPKPVLHSNQLVIVTWLYTKAVLHSKLACGCHMVLHKAVLHSNQLVIVIWLHTKAVLHSNLLRHSPVPFEAPGYHQASYWPFLVQVDQVGNVVGKLHISNHHLRVGFSGNRKIQPIRFCFFCLFSPSPMVGSPLLWTKSYERCSLFKSLVGWNVQLCRLHLLQGILPFKYLPFQFIQLDFPPTLFKHRATCNVGSEPTITCDLMSWRPTSAADWALNNKNEWTTVLFLHLFQHKITPV